MLVRHGSTHLHETGELLRDDPLGIVGRMEATALQKEVSSLDVNIVLCSPLQRALETAIRAFAGRPDVQLFIHPELREFNMKQREKEPLFQRHQGHTMRELKHLFPSAPSTPEIVWPANVNDDDEWWEPHGDYCRNSDSTCQTAQERVYAFCEALCNIYCENPAAKVCVVAHETVFRAMTGCPKFPTATVVRASLSTATLRDARPVVIQCSTGPSTLPGVDLCVESDLPVLSRHAIVIVGGPTGSAFESLRSRSRKDDLVLISCKETHFRAWIEHVEASIAANVITVSDACERVIIDPYASSPAEHATRCIIRLNALGDPCVNWCLHIVTEESHEGVVADAFEAVVSAHKLQDRYLFSPASKSCGQVPESLSA
jgi:broad specificity phosphatase PhoE